MRPNIVHRYLYAELIKMVLLFIFCFYSLYVLIDYGAHMKTLHQEGLSFLNVIFYYTLQFAKRAEIILPFALLIGSLKVATSLNMRGELLALVTSGISYKNLLKPFLITALFVSSFL